MRPIKDNKLLQVEKIFSGYGKKEVLHGVSLKVKAGEIVCLIGPNGSGKSTVLKTIMGYLKPFNGRIFFTEKDISGMATHKIVKHMRISFCAQGRTIFPEMTVSEHLDMGAWTIENKEKEKEIVERVYRLFPRLQERKNQKARKMSGGERQMLSLGRAMMIEPELLILDEPSLGLAPKFLDQVFEMILKINREEGVPVLMVEQNATKGLENSDRGYALEMGNLRFEGKSQDLLENEKVRQLYLGG